jgi:hypothetical protein
MGFDFFERAVFGFFAARQRVMAGPGLALPCRKLQFAINNIAAYAFCTCANGHFYLKTWPDQLNP